MHTTKASKAVSLIGTGKIGAGVCRALVSAGFNVVAYNRTRQKVLDLQNELSDKSGTLVCSQSLTDCISASSVIFSTLFE